MEVGEFRCWTTDSQVWLNPKDLGEGDVNDKRDISYNPSTLKSARFQSKASP